MLILDQLSALCIREREKITHCQWNQINSKIESNQGAVHENRYSMKIKKIRETKISFCDVTFVAQTLANLLALDHD